ncbi:MAG TPA: glycosyltransferase [Terriglobales bacterium]|nr:glycosyltransferase [Terriglobales bacterium]
MNIWNGAPFLREAIDSVLSQSFLDWELIAWDDCSTDNSAEVVKSYTDPRIRYIRAEKQVPLGHARNMALQEVRGEWIAFLDQDDIWTPDKLEKQLALGKSSPEVGFVYGRAVSFNPSGEKKDFDQRHEFEPLPEGAILKELYVDACFIAMSSAMFRRTALETIGGIPPNIHMSPDYHMYLGVSQRFQARAVQDVICYYRIHNSNMTPRTFKQVHCECLWLIDHWGKTVSPHILSWRRKVHSTLVALKELENQQTRREGLVRLLRDGSLPYLFSRPFVRTFRAVRRKIQQPYWQRANA